MSWSNDPEMQKMFLDEVAERSARLVEGAQALRAGSVTSQEAGDYLREGHTIKGTGRVMGYEDVGSAGLMLEMIWRWIQQGDITPVPIFGRILEALSAAIPRSLDDPVALSEAMDAVHDFFEGESLPEELPPPPEMTATESGAGIVEPQADVANVEATAAAVNEDDATIRFYDSEPTSGIDASAAEPEAQAGREPDGVEAGSDEPVSSAHQMFAQLAADGAAPGESVVDEDVADDALGVEVVESVAVDDAVEAGSVEPVLSAHEMFAQLAADGADLDESDGSGVAAAGAAAVEVEESFDDESETVEAEAESVGDAVETVDEEPEMVDGHPAEVEAEVDAAEAAAEDEPIGSVIDFPVADSDATDTDVSEDGAEPVAATETIDDVELTDVVVLPSNRADTSRSVTEPDDLGGLVGAVQTWAAEEPISVNTGRLYGLVNHIVSLRMGIESARTELVELAELAAADPFFSDRVSHLSEAMAPIADSSEAIEAQALALAASPLRDVTNTLPQLGRYLSRKTGKELRVEIVGDDILVDRQVLDRLGDAIRQLVVNAAVHGIEDIDTRLGAAKPGTGTIRVEADQTDVNLEVSVMDDGRGIDWQGIREKGLALGLLEPSLELAPDSLRSLLYQSGFTTQEQADELAGDGDGLAIVRDAMESLNGSLRVESSSKVETRISMIVPVHQAMQKALLVRTAGIMWGIPETGIVDVVDMHLATIVVADHTTVLERVDGDVPFASFADLLGLSSDAVPASIVVATSAAGPVALGVEEVVGVRRVAAKELGAVLADAEADVVTGAALLGGDQVVLLVDPTRLAERQREVAVEAPAFPAARVLVVDDSVGVQQVVSSALATSGFNASVASSVADALGALQTGTIDAIVVDFSMPRADGVALAHMVRQRHGDMPIVMLSGVAEGEDVDRARDAGVDAFFNKADFREGGLAEKLRQLISARRSEEQTA